MKLFEYIDRINLLHKLIRERRSGNPEQLARRLSLSTSRLYGVLEELKIMGAPIEYSREIQSYFYTEAFEMSLKASFTLLNAQELLRTNAGFLNKITHSFFCRVSEGKLDHDYF